MEGNKGVKMITGIFLIPELNHNTNKDANMVVDAIIYQLGALNCENDNGCAIIKYTGILNEDTKTVFTNIAKQYGHSVLYLEAEDETPFANDDTFHIPTNAEMKEHLSITEL